METPTEAPQALHPLVQAVVIAAQIVRTTYLQTIATGIPESLDTDLNLLRAVLIGAETTGAIDPQPPTERRPRRRPHHRQYTGPHES